MENPLNQIDTKELALPETLFIRDIETKVFQSIVVQVLSQIEGVEPLEGSLFDDLLGDGVDGIKGIHIDQELKTHSVNVRIEVNVAYGLTIPEKAEEIQTRIVQEISRLTSLHVGRVHVIFKNLISPKEEDSLESLIKKCARERSSSSSERYDEVF